MQNRDVRGKERKEKDTIYSHSSFTSWLDLYYSDGDLLDSALVIYKEATDSRDSRFPIFPDRNA